MSARTRTTAAASKVEVADAPKAKTEVVENVEDSKTQKEEKEKKEEKPTVEKGADSDQDAKDKRIAELEELLARKEAQEKEIQTNIETVPIQQVRSPEEVVKEASKTQEKLVKVTAIKDHDTHIGGRAYTFRKGHGYDVPADVAAILSNAFVLVKK